MGFWTTDFDLITKSDVDVARMHESTYNVELRRALTKLLSKVSCNWRFFWWRKPRRVTGNKSVLTSAVFNFDFDARKCCDWWLWCDLLRHLFRLTWSHWCSHYFRESIFLKSDANANERIMEKVRFLFYKVVLYSNSSVKIKIIQ